MRDPKRIARITSKLLAYWYAHPDLRLGQIVANLASFDSSDRSVLGFVAINDDPYHFEDDRLEIQLDKALAAFERDPNYLS